MSDLLVSAWLGAGFIVWFLGAVVAVLMVFVYPVLAFSLVRHVKGVRAEVARLNDNLERRPRTVPEAAIASESHEDLPLYVPGMHTPTGPLKIR